MKRRVVPVAISLVVVASAACTSPETTRLRGGGPGADPGNRAAVVQMHEGSRPYQQTPRLIGAHGMEDLSPSRQAHELSLPERRQGR